MNIYKWWKQLPWQNKKLDEVASPDSFRRKRPLTLKEIFFRDRVAVITNVLFPIVLIIFIILNIIKGAT